MYLCFTRRDAFGSWRSLDDLTSSREPVVVVLPTGVQVWTGGRRGCWYSEPAWARYAGSLSVSVSFFLN